MPELSSPFGGAVIEVPKELVDRFAEAGWVKSEPKKAPAKKPASKKSAEKPSDKNN